MVGPPILAFLHNSAKVCFALKLRVPPSGVLIASKNEWR